LEDEVNDSVDSDGSQSLAESSSDSDRDEDAESVEGNTAPSTDTLSIRMKRLIAVLGSPTKYDACLECVPCLQPRRNGEKKLEDAKFSCVSMECPRCGFDKIWSSGIRNRIILKEYEPSRRAFVEKLNPNCSMATDAWHEEVYWRAYVYKEGPSIAANAREIAQRAAAARPPEADDSDYNPTESKTARNLVLETYRGTLIDYLDFLEIRLTVHLDHRHLVSTEHRSKKDYERNSRPWAVEQDIDFSENGSIENFDKVQSEHWVTRQYTLFMQVASFLEVDEWNKHGGNLEVGQEVTAHGELYIRDVGNPYHRPEINLSSYWATVTKKNDNGSYTITDANGEETSVIRSNLRLRKRHIIALPVISDDKRHDRFATIHNT
jgi:hypothetical protein